VLRSFGSCRSEGRVLLRPSLLQRSVAEGVATALLLAVVVGSGIMAERLSGGNGAIALLANAAATGAGLVALILAFGPVSGAHLNPLVTAVEWLLGHKTKREAAAYTLAQFAGAGCGVVLAHFLFELPLVQTSTHVRAGAAQIGSEALATFGLLTVVLSVAKHRVEAVPYAVGTYITAAYWFTSSTSFANPAVTIARSLTDTFTGIRPLDVPGFVVGQLVGASLAVAFLHWIQSPEIPT
jgi:glycerol uptake facilitator-like aquaporin